MGGLHFKLSFQVFAFFLNLHALDWRASGLTRGRRFNLVGNERALISQLHL